MSHFARIVENMPSWVKATAELVTVGVDTEIKRVKIVDGSIYQFEAFLNLGDVRAWVLLETEEDLPAFTDKGRAHRARQKHATLAPGRPLEGEEHVVRPVAVRVSATQRQWVARKAARKHLTVSEYLRGLLEADGMPG